MLKIHSFKNRYLIQTIFIALGISIITGFMTFFNYKSAMTENYLELAKKNLEMATFAVDQYHKNLRSFYSRVEKNLEPVFTARTQALSAALNPVAQSRTAKDADLLSVFQKTRPGPFQED